MFNTIRPKKGELLQTLSTNKLIYLFYKKNVFFHQTHRIPPTGADSFSMKRTLSFASMIIPIEKLEETRFFKKSHVYTVCGFGRAISDRWQFVAMK
jgi:hypothetical protein